MTPKLSGRARARKVYTDRFVPTSAFSCQQKLAWIKTSPTPLQENGYIELTELVSFLIFGTSIKCSKIRAMSATGRSTTLGDTRAIREGMNVIMSLDWTWSIFGQDPTREIEQCIAKTDDKIFLRNRRGLAALCKVFDRRVDSIYNHIRSVALSGRIKLTGIRNNQLVDIHPLYFETPKFHDIERNMVGPALATEPPSLSEVLVIGGHRTHYEAVRLRACQAHKLLESLNNASKSSEKIRSKPGPKSAKSAVHAAARECFPPDGRRPLGMRMARYDQEIAACYRKTAQHSPGERTIAKYTKHLR